MSTIRAKHSPQCESASYTGGVDLSVLQQPFCESLEATPPPIPIYKPVQYNFDQRAERNQSLVITAVGKSGVGTSTMINNFLGLRHDKMSPTGDDVDPTTTKVEMHSNYKSCIEIKVCEVPGLGGTKKNETVAVLKGVSKSETDILLYNVSLHPSGKIDTTDVENSKLLTAVFGRKIWSRAVLVANQRSSKNEDVYRELLKLKTLNDPQEVAEVFGSATAGVAMGAAAGAEAGAPLQALTASSGKAPAMQAELLYLHPAA